ncbi:restriction endonuclease [Paenibacillus illinoisensis]|uniref:restriction endonuclease n=1 Tax=Paenibacillus illinoisensis TaxID=59845 RepID=UPI003D97F67F
MVDIYPNEKSVRINGNESKGFFDVSGKLLGFYCDLDDLYFVDLVDVNDVTVFISSKTSKIDEHGVFERATITIQDGHLLVTAEGKLDEVIEYEKCEIKGITVLDRMLKLQKDLDLKIDYSNHLIELSMVIEESQINRELIEYMKDIENFVQNAVKSSTEVIWKEIYHTNERKFCEELLEPLFIKMGFHDVKYRQGVREYGKDFTFSELTSFNNTRHIAVQAKAGDVKGNVNSSVDELIGQIEDAFTMPYNDLGSSDDKYISSFIIVISGKFSDNAEEKIRKKILTRFKGLYGSIEFLDKRRVLGLLQKYFK